MFFQETGEERLSLLLILVACSQEITAQHGRERECHERGGAEGRDERHAERHEQPPFKPRKEEEGYETHDDD